MKPTLKPGLTHRLAGKDAENHSADGAVSRAREFAAEARKIAQVA